MTERRKRLIEVAFPLEEVSSHSRDENANRRGHIKNLHRWWARRPLAACRAFIYASLVDDPPTELEREELLREVADLASWDAVRKPTTVVRQRDKGGSGLTGHVLLQRARERILRDNGGKPPRLLDPFAGGGAIPLEALRLGCEVDASDLNPVAVLILKGTVEYPQKYGRPLAEQREKRPDDCAGVNGQLPDYIRESAKSLQGSFGESDAVAAYEKNPLAADVRYWGNWMLEKAREELAQFYPPDLDGSVPVAYLWSRTVPCPNCGVQMPLMRQYWLARRDRKKVALKPVVDQANKCVDFEVVQGDNIVGDPAEATTSGGDTLCLVCRQTVKAEYVRKAGREGKLSAVLTAVALQAGATGGKKYRADNAGDARAVLAAAAALSEMEGRHSGDLPLIPDEPVPYDPRKVDIELYGLDEWGKCFNQRQLVALTTLVAGVEAAHREMGRAGLAATYAEALSRYLAIALSRYSDFASTLSRWKSDAEAVVDAHSGQGMPMVWDYAEHVATSTAGGSFRAMIYLVCEAITTATTDGTPARVSQRDARLPQEGPGFDLILTDPPYYDSFNYADLSDFFYVWIKRALEFLHDPRMALPLTPKREQAVMNPYSFQPGRDRPTKARAAYVTAMAESFSAMNTAIGSAGGASVVFAHTDVDAWATLIEGLLATRLVPCASWPLDTELETRTASSGQARLKTSVWMSCRPRDVEAGPAFLGDLQEELRREVESKLLDFWRRGIRGADFFISAIGPALAVYGRHSKVLRPDGSEVTVRDFLDIVRRESTRVALQQVLGGESLGIIDAVTQAYVTWAWSYGKAPLDAGEAIALCLATGADLDELTRPHAVAEMVREKSKKVVRLRSIGARAREDDELGHGNGARTTPLIDQLQLAASLWGANSSSDLAKFRAELGEPRWKALRVLGQAVAECLPEGDDDRRLVNGMLGSSVTAGSAAPAVAGQQHRLDLAES